MIKALTGRLSYSRLIAKIARSGRLLRRRAGEHPVRDALAAGEHTFTLEARADGGSGVNLGTRSLDAASFRPIWNPPTFERVAR